MKNGNSEHDLDSIVERLEYQHTLSEVLLDHVAFVEATVSVLMDQTLPDEDLRVVKRLRDQILPEISNKIVNKVKRYLEDS
jgi:hypothetical protein